MPFSWTTCRASARSRLSVAKLTRTRALPNAPMRCAREPSASCACGRSTDPRWVLPGRTDGDQPGDGAGRACGLLALSRHVLYAGGAVAWPEPIAAKWARRGRTGLRYSRRHGRTRGWFAAPAVAPAGARRRDLRERLFQLC